MIRVFAHIAREQARNAAAWAFAAWAVTLALGLLAAALEGDLPAAPFAPRFWVPILALALAPALLAAMPLSLVAHAVRLRETGELVAAAATGVSPSVVALALAVPWLPLLWVVDVHAHTVRPAALNALVDSRLDDLARDPAQLLPELGGQGIAACERGGRTRVLMPTATGFAAIQLDRPLRTTGGTIDAGPGRFVFGTGPAAPIEGAFSRAVLQPPDLQRPLSRRTERELTTAFLDHSIERYARARAPEADGRELWRRERRRRTAMAVCGLLALVWSVGSVWAHRLGAWMAWAAFALPALAIGLVGPRGVGAW